MNSVIEKYFSNKRDELMLYVNEIIPMFSYNKELPIDNKTQSIKKILNIYFKKYYKVLNINYDLLSKHYNLGDEIDIDFKNIMQCVVEYYVNENKDILKNNDSIIYFSSVIYFAFLIERLRDTIIILPNKIDFIISISNKVSPLFTYTKNDRFKNHINKLVSLIKKNIKRDTKISSILETSNDEGISNDYICINDENNLYRLRYNYNNSELKEYKRKDIKKVFDNENMDSVLKLQSYQLSLITLLKCILNNQRISVVLEIKEDFYKKKSYVSSLIKLIDNNYTASYTKLLIKAENYKKNENLELLKSYGIKIIIDSNKFEEVKNIEFDENMILITSNEFIVKYKQDLDKMGIKYIKKNSERTYKEKDLFFTKVDFLEVNNE